MELLANKLLPYQPEQLKRYNGHLQDVADKLAFICNQQSILPPFNISVPHGVNLQDLASPAVELDLLTFLIRLLRPRKVLEIGSFIGISTMAMASALPEGGTMVTIEKDQVFANYCRYNLEMNFAVNPVLVVQGDAFSILKALSLGDFDFVFIDGAKEDYAKFLSLLSVHLPSGAFVVMDDCFFNGDTLNEEPTTEKGHGVKDALAFTAKCGWNKVLLPMCNGIMLMRKS